MLSDNNNNNDDKISYSPMEIINNLKQYYPSCTLWNDNDKDNGITLNKDSRIKMCLKIDYYALIMIMMKMKT